MARRLRNHESLPASQPIIQIRLMERYGGPALTRINVLPIPSFWSLHDEYVQAISSFKRLHNVVLKISEDA